MSSQRAGTPLFLEPQNSLHPATPQDSTARRKAAEKEKRREELTAPSAAPGDVSELLAGHWKGGIRNREYRARGGGADAFSYRGLPLRVHIHQCTPAMRPVHLLLGSQLGPQP